MYFRACTSEPIESTRMDSPRLVCPFWSLLSSALTPPFVVHSALAAVARAFSRSPMLLELRAENYAVVDHAVAEFGPGLNLLTGETGADKSILVDALALLLGGKGSSDLVRFGAEKAVLGCVFESTPGAEELHGRERPGQCRQRSSVAGARIGASGKGRVFVNNQPATVAVLRQLAPEPGPGACPGGNAAGVDAEQQRLLLDRFGALETEKTGVAFGEWRPCGAQIAELETAEDGPAAAPGFVELSGKGDRGGRQSWMGKKIPAWKWRSACSPMPNGFSLPANAAQELLYEAEVSANHFWGRRCVT